jgi:carbonic anhydrase
MASEDPQDVRRYLQQSHDRIFENNKKWAEEQKAKHPEFFEKLSAGQAPEYLWIGASMAPLRPQKAYTAYQQHR